MAELNWIDGAVGADEAGRGPLAGPVVAAAVRFPAGAHIKGLNDSKKLTPTKREALALEIRERAEWSIALATPEQIDKDNILWASMDAIRRAVEDLLPGGPILIDGNRLPRAPWAPQAEAVVKGDGKLACIAAASILAKTYRDALMKEYAAQYPEYGFDLHFGYPTPEHLAALQRHRPCPIHRRSFGPVRSFFEAETGSLFP